MTDPITDEAIRKLWRDAGGSFYGPRVEHANIKESDFLPFMRGLLSRLDKAEGRDRTQATFEVYQDGAPVAMASGPRERAYAEAMHYVAVYGQDGLPIELYEHVPVALPPPPSES